MTTGHDRKLRHSALIISCISVVIANLHFTLLIYSLSGLFFIFLTPNCLLILIEFELRKRIRIFS